MASPPGAGVAVGVAPQHLLINLSGVASAYPISLLQGYVVGVDKPLIGVVVVEFVYCVENLLAREHVVAIHIEEDGVGRAVPHPQHLALERPHIFMLSYQN